MPFDGALATETILKDTALPIASIPNPASGNSAPETYHFRPIRSQSGTVEFYLSQLY
jgi:hypothetical protein